MAKQLWRSRIHEASILASYIDEPMKVTDAQLEKWAKDFDSWDVCDQVYGLFEETPHAYKKAIEWSSRKEEFVKRAAFTLIASLAVHDKKASDEQFEQFFPLVLNYSGRHQLIVRSLADDRRTGNDVYPSICL